MKEGRKEGRKTACVRVVVGWRHAWNRTGRKDGWKH